MEKIKIKNILSGLECPVCNHTLKPPTHCCKSGHTLCDSCYEKLPNTPKSCPECRQLLDGRNHALENLLEFIAHPCKYQKTGCPVEVFPEDLEKHESNCEWRPVGCLHPSCTKTLPIRNFDKHILEDHRDHVRDVNVRARTSLTISTKEDALHTFFLRDLESQKVLPYYINAELNSNVLTMCMCSWAEAKHYDLELTTKQNSSLKLSFSTLTVPVTIGLDSDWKNHEYCFSSKVLIIGVNSETDIVVNISIDMRDDAKLSAAAMSAEEEEQIVSNLFNLCETPWAESHEVVLKLLEEHEKRCEYKLADCVIPGCRESVWAWDLKGHILRSHGEALGVVKDATTMDKLCRIAFQCAGPMCAMKIFLLSQYQFKQSKTKTNPCEIGNCNELVSDDKFEQHYNEKHISEHGTVMQALTKQCTDTQMCTVKQSMEKLFKKHNLKCSFRITNCPLLWCQIKHRDLNDHLNRYHAYMFLDVKEWSEDKCFEIPVPAHRSCASPVKVYPNPDVYFLRPEGRFRLPLLLTFAYESDSIVVCVRDFNSGEPLPYSLGLRTEYAIFSEKGETQKLLRVSMNGAKPLSLTFKLKEPK